VGALPAGSMSDHFAGSESRDLKPWLLGAALALLLADMAIALALRGLLGGWRRRGATGAAAGALFLLLLPAMGPAQHEDPEKFAIDNAGQTRLAYVVTGNDESDKISKAGLYGLSLVIAQRTAADLGQPIGLDVENDDLAFFPLIYWRVPPDAQPLSQAAI